METSNTTSGGPRAGEENAAARCPVDHSAVAARSTIPASALPGPQMPVPMQLYKYRTLRTDWLMQLRQQYGHRFRLNIRPKMNIYVLSDPEDVKQMFLAPRDKLHTGNGSAVLQKFMGNTGLAFLDEGEHLARRKSLLPAFKGDAFRRIQDSIDERARRAITTWPRNHVASLHPFAHRYTTEVIREVIFGSFVPSCWDELRDEVLGTMDFNTHAATFFLLHKMKRLTVRALEAFRPTGLHDFLRHRERADALIAQAVRERMEHGELGDDMLSVMLGIKHDDGTPLSAVELRDEMMTMFVAGTETTAAAICWSLEMLSRTPAVRDRLIAEIDEGTDDAYLTATVHEVLRLRPPLPNIILREVMKPIEIGGVRYEPGDQLWASAYLLNRDAERYEEPEEFRPERFLNIKPGTYTWIPFGGGHIRCLGDRIGIHEVKAMLREVLSTCELHRADPTPEGTRSRGVVIVPEHGARLELRPRQPEAALADR